MPKAEVALLLVGKFTKFEVFDTKMALWTLQAILVFF